MYLVRDGHMSTGNPALDTDLRDLKIVASSAGGYLYGTTGRNGGMAVYELSPNGGLGRAHDQKAFAPWQADSVAGLTAILEIDGQKHAIFGGTGGTQLLGFSIAPGGALGRPTQTVALAGATDRITAIVEAEINGRDVIFVADEGTGRLTSYVGQSDGSFTALGTGMALPGPPMIETAQVGQTQFLLRTDPQTNGVASYRMGAEGRLSPADSQGARDGLGVATPTALNTLEAYGSTWVLLGAADSASISVMRLEASGHLAPTDHVIDTRYTRFDDLSDMATVTAQGWAFVVVGGSDGGMSLFLLLPTGRILHLDTLIHSHGAGLENIQSIEAAVIGDALQIFVTSTLSGGVTQFSLSLADLGQVIQGADDGPGQTLRGSARDDLMVASLTGDDTLSGGTGDDILVAQAGDAVLWGGAGDDTFVLNYHSQALKIMDFTPGRDRLDLSAFPMLYDMAQLGLTDTATGARLSFGSADITVVSSTGRPLDLSDLFGAGFDWANHMPISFPSSNANESAGSGGTAGKVLIGGRGRDALSGASGNDRLVGNNGNDTLDGWAGSDTILGGAGADQISGMDGNDILNAGGGNDRVWGGAGDDRIAGGDGADLLVGSDGHDLVQGEGGHDTLRGLNGNDTLDGGWGADSLSGGFGNDSLVGGDGHDQVWGDHGNDTLLGGVGSDTLGGFVGDDWFYGGDGNDVIWGNAGTDRGWGGAGNDTLGGGDDSDTLHGNDGNDLVWGGHQSDLQYGDAGDDTVGGFSGDDTLYGGTGNDQIWGNVGDDLGFGEDGNDLFGGFAGNDTFYGGAGEDTLSGGTGDDLLWGGSDADSFRFMGTVGRDTVGDFEPGIDMLHFYDPTLSFQSLVLWQSGPDTIITLRTGEITLLDTQASALGPGDFLFD